MEMRLINRDEFTTFANKFVDKSPYQTVEYAESMKNENFGYMLIGLFDGTNLISATMLLVQEKGHYKYAYAPRGFLINYSDFNLVKEFTHQIKNFLNKYGIIAVKLCPMIVKNAYDSSFNTMYRNKNYNNIYDNLINLGYYHYGYNNKFESLKPRFEAIVDLDKPYYEAFKSISKKYRTKIRSAERLGIKIYKSTKESIELLYNQTQNKYPRSLEYFKGIITNFNDSAELYYAKLDTTVYLKEIQRQYLEQEQKVNNLNKKIMKKSNPSLIKKKLNEDKLLNLLKNKLNEATDLAKFSQQIVLSSILVIKLNNQIFSLIDAYDKKYTYLNAKHLLIWKIIEKYCKEGVNTLNLGGVAYTTEKDDVYSGLLKFKLNMGSNIYEYLGDLELVINQRDYVNFKNINNIKKIFK